MICIILKMKHNKYPNKSFLNLNLFKVYIDIIKL
jgi:hypothetical protein